MTIRIIILSLFLLGITACGSAKMMITNFDKDGNVTSTNKISYIRVGSGELSEVDVNIKTGKAKIGSQKGSAGDMAEALLNLTEIAKKAVAVP